LDFIPADADARHDSLRRIAGRFSAIGVMLLWAAAVLFADGGTLLFRKPAGSFVVTAFSEPAPMRAGKADLSVMVEKTGDQSTVLDADVKLRLKKTEAGSIVEIVVPATHGHATNKLLYAASLTLPSTGMWRMTVDVREKGEEASAAGDLDVLPAEPPLMAHWPLFAVVPLMILFFLLNQWLKSRRNSRRGRLQR